MLVKSDCSKRGDTFGDGKGGGTEKNPPAGELPDQGPQGTRFAAGEKSTFSAAFFSVPLPRSIIVS